MNEAIGMGAIAIGLLLLILVVMMQCSYYLMKIYMRGDRQ